MTLALRLAMTEGELGTPTPRQDCDWPWYTQGCTARRGASAPMDYSAVELLE